MKDFGNIKELFDQITEYWSPKIIAEVNDDYIKIAKLKGDFVWHTHEHEDEMFYIVKGHLEIQLEAEIIHLNQGEYYVVKKGIRHSPLAKQECWVLLIEKKETLHTGDVITEHSKTIEDQLK
ncbi:MAG: cupin domain-containing protein [Bacilli bacterium]|nr:cupin domain-containing protein [Bacilli bacterium]MBN2877209.1 cupin domain-containing protein [Bacilli bacterium]